MVKRKKMEVSDHLNDLRSAIIPPIGAFIVLVPALFIFSGSVISYTRSSFVSGMRLISITPMEYLHMRIFVSFLGALIAVLPLLTYTVFLFIKPGLRKSEKRVMVLYTPMFFMLMGAGMLFAYKFITPITVKFLIGYGYHVAVPLIQVSKLIYFIVISAVISGVIFQIPVLISLLVRTDVVTRSYLKEKRSYVYGALGVSSMVMLSGSSVLPIITFALAAVMFEAGIAISRVI